MCLLQLAGVLGRQDSADSFEGGTCSHYRASVARHADKTALKQLPRSHPLASARLARIERRRLERIKADADAANDARLDEAADFVCLNRNAKRREGDATSDLATLDAEVRGATDRLPGVVREQPDRVPAVIV